MEPTRCLMSVRDTHSLLAPLGESKRIKYTCVAASPHYVVLGANTGGVYCFHRDGYKYIRILANKEGGVSLLRFSPSSENILAAVTGGSYVALWELNLHEQGVSKRFHVSPLLKDSTIRDIAWDSKGTRLFYGDDVGRVGVAYIPKQKLFKKPDEICLIEKSSIVQLDYHQEMLLVSTQQRSLLFKPSTREALQVGKKTRDGLFGACFHSRWQDRPPVVYSARPGGRLWEADIEGTVLSTLKLKDLVVDGPSASPIFGVGFQPDLVRSSQFQPPKLLHFSYLSILHNTYMVGVADHTLFLFNPASYKLAARSCDLGTIVNLYCDGQQLFVVCEGERAVRVVDFMDIGTCVCELVKQGLIQQAVLVVDRFSSEVQSALHCDGALYKAVKSTLALAQSKHTGSSEVSPSLQAVLTTLGEVREKFETTELLDERDLEEQVEQKVEIKVEEIDGDGYQTIDLNAYSNTSLTQLDTDDTDVTASGTLLVNGMESDAKEVKIADTEPDLDATLMDDDTAGHNDTGDHSDIEMDPLASSSQTKLMPETTIERVSSSLDEQINIDQSESTDVKDAENLITVDIQTQPDHSVTSEVTPLIESDKVVQPARSKSKAIPPRAKSASQRTENAELPDESSSNSLTSATPSSVGGHNRISLSEPQSLDRQTEQSDNSPLSLGGSMGFASVQKSKGKSDFAQRVETALNKQLSISSIASNEGEDDLIAIPVSKGGSGNIGEGGESSVGGTSGGGKGKKRKSKRKKNPAPSRRMSSPDIKDPSYTKTPSPGRSSSLHHILEEETLPFPEAGLPPTPPSRSSHPHTPHSSEPASLTVSPYPSLPSSPPRHTQTLTDLANLGKNASALFSKVKTLTTQFAEKVETQQTQKQVKNVVKDIFSSLASPQQHGGQATGSSSSGGGSHDVSMMSSHLFQNNDFALPISPQSEPEMGEFAAVGSPSTALSSDRSDGRISAPMSPLPASTSLPEEELSYDPNLAEFSEATVEAKRQLEDPMVLCFAEEITSLLTKWLQSLESLAAYLTSSSPCPSPNHTHSTQANMDSTTVVVKDGTSTNQQYLGEARRKVTFEEVSKAFLGQTYQNLSDIVKTAVSELATLCAEMEVYAFESLSSGAAEKDKDHDSTTDTGSEKDHGLTSEKERELEDGTTSSIVKCSSLVEFVCCYGPLLDSVRLKQLLSSKEWGERRECLAALLQAKEAETCSAEAFEASPEDGEDPGGNMLTRLISKPSQFLEYCIKHFPTLLSWEIAVVCGVDQWDAATKSCDSHMDQSDVSLHYSLYADYINRLFAVAKESARVKGLLSAMFRGDSNLLLNTMNVLLQLDRRNHPKADYTSDSDTPRAWSHVGAHWPNGEICEQLVDILLAMENTELLETARNLCQKRQYWVGVVHLSVAMGDKRTALCTLFQLRDKRLFDANQKWGNLLTSLEDWKLLVELVNDLDHPLPDREYADTVITSREGLETAVATTADQTASEGDQPLSEYVDGNQLMSERVNVDQVASTTDEGLNDGRTECCYSAISGAELTQLELLKLMLGSLPPLAVNELLSSRCGDCFGGKTREQLHSVLSKLTSIHTQQRSLAHSMLERVDSYLWSQRPSTVGPQVVIVQNLDKQLDQSKDRVTPTSAGGVLITSVPPTSSSIEDANTHWGVIVGRSPESGGHCPICRLPLTKPVSDLQPGIIIFQCGHSYHNLCLPEQACLVCFNKNSQKLLATYLEQV